MSKIFSSISCNLDANILKAALPLLQSEKVEAIEWSFDTLYNHRKIPQWFVDLVAAFGNQKRLIGHGVFFSLFSGKWSASQEDWLAHLRKMAHNFNFDHITEHFGFMTGEDFHKGAPIGVPLTPTTLAIGRDRMQRISEAANCPVGLENLAFSYSLEAIKKHGEFLGKLVEPVNGFIILDLHNLYCQIHNFDVSFDDLIQLYPLELVREIHISGGSWEASEIEPEKKIRRDTHDDAVPNEVFQLLDKTIEQCPNLKYVVLEQIGAGLETDESRKQFQNDFLKMDEIVKRKSEVLPKVKTESFLNQNMISPGKPLEDETLHQQQKELSNILETSKSYSEVRNRLSSSNLANSDWDIEKWKPEMLETVFQIAQKWKYGFVSNESSH